MEPESCSNCGHRKACALARQIKDEFMSSSLWFDYEDFFYLERRIENLPISEGVREAINRHVASICLHYRLEKGE